MILLPSVRFASIRLWSVSSVLLRISDLKKKAPIKSWNSTSYLPLHTAPKSCWTGVICRIPVTFMLLQCLLPNLCLSWLIFYSLKNVVTIIQFQNTLKWTEGAELNTDFGLRMTCLWRRKLWDGFQFQSIKPHQINWNQGWSLPVISTGQSQKPEVMGN